MGTVGRSMAKLAFPKVAARYMPRAGQPGQSTSASMINTTGGQPQPQPAPAPASMIGSR